ncbi:hypothetical protein EJ05DRAFT_144324 [Pseudovirgaria hyperparasitica]|uniref:Uncharacterized protein n=1 Tax=Pseudovirgaria hyperparasitica TaxID=470096 RepID=A0A6A6VXK3_9PEZI|nr:uncharacterized protein EJ05DRAFT_144324 [Pseudovirgaria hyperparasitica]KAF2754536.1 hypothetical protein EJ05DRAFT_144324 [Pseudovirgaria hyperparasitica]
MTALTTLSSAIMGQQMSSGKSCGRYAYIDAVSTGSVPFMYNNRISRHQNLTTLLSPVLRDNLLHYLRTMAPDPHQGGDLSDMAATGTSIPGDAGKMNLIKSVPRPYQDTDSSNPLEAADQATAASNNVDIPRTTKDVGTSAPDVITGTGDQLPATVQTKNLHTHPSEPDAKGHDRYEKHMRHNNSAFDRLASAGAEVDRAPGEEEDDQDTVRDRKGA